MPPYENESLHDMHALMQQLDTLNAAHSPEYLAVGDDDKKPAKKSFFTMPSIPFGKKTTAPAADTPLSEKDVIWKILKGGQRKTVFKNAFQSILEHLTEDDYADLKKTLESNVKTKELFVACIVSNVPASE
jgi:hypothetical protein